MLRLSYYVDGFAVYSGRCTTSHGVLEDDWMLFPWPESRRVWTLSVALHAGSSCLVPVHVALSYVSNLKCAGAYRCVSCGVSVHDSWCFCEECTHPLCDSCTCTCRTGGVTCLRAREASDAVCL